MRPLLIILGLWWLRAGAFAADSTPTPEPVPAPAPPAPAPEPAPEPSAAPPARPHARVMLGITFKEQDDGQSIAIFPPAVIGSVALGTNAQRIGLKVGDIITSLNGHAVANAGDVVHALSLVSPGDAATLVVTRAGASITLTGVFQAFELPGSKAAQHDDAIMP